MIAARCDSGGQVAKNWGEAEKNERRMAFLRISTGVQTAFHS
jgi:hypothetical protein